MTLEEKELLLKDLCARLPYMPKIKIIYQQQGIKGTDEGSVSCDFIEKIVNDLRNGIITDMQIYLRPMSNMTEEEMKKYHSYCECDDGDFTGEILYFDTIESFDYLNSIHVDYRNLISRGLSIEVTEDNNPYK